jgi:hypothetical protein
MKLLSRPGPTKICRASQEEEWQDYVMQDTQTVKIKIWRRIAMNRSGWNQTAEQARTHKGCRASQDEEEQ